MFHAWAGKRASSCPEINQPYPATLGASGAVAAATGVLAVATCQRNNSYFNGVRNYDGASVSLVS
jgi:hypothetical protein